MVMEANVATCETCGGTGECMEMVCYGGAPYEVTNPCPDCDGPEDEIETPKTATSTNPDLMRKRVRDW